MSGPLRLPNGDLEIEMLTLDTGEEMGVFDQVEHEGRTYLLLLSKEAIQDVSEADPEAEEPLDVEMVLAEEIDGCLVEIADPEVIALVEGLLGAAEGDPDVLEAAAGHLEAERGMAGDGQ